METFPLLWTTTIMVLLLGAFLTPDNRLLLRVNGAAATKNDGGGPTRPHHSTTSSQRRQTTRRNRSLQQTTTTTTSTVSTPRLEWEVQIQEETIGIGNGVFVSPTSSNIIVVATADGNVHAFDSETGTLLWKYEYENQSSTYTGPVLTDLTAANIVEEKEETAISTRSHSGVSFGQYQGRSYLVYAVIEQDEEVQEEYT